MFNQKIFNLLIFFAIIFPLNGYSFVVLIDPGHGGEELGAKSIVHLKNSKGRKYSRDVYEKDLTLILAKKVKKYLENKFTTYLTRSFDRTVTLEKRAELAETVKADLFISIHFNSFPEGNSHGFETYYLDNHDDVAIKKVEDIENKNLIGEDKVINQILIDLVIQKTVPSSKKLANYVHTKVGQNIIKKYAIKDRGVKPGLFYVLALSKRPGILVEAGFLSNQKELRKLRTNKFLDKYAQGIAAGVVEFYENSPKRELPVF